MNYYPHHIGDFNNATRHLTRLERDIYRDLIELYYDTEQQLTKDFDALCRIILARTNEERTAVEQALNEFFIETDTGWFHDRCDSEIESYRANTTQKSAAGKASAAKRALKRQQALNGNSTDVERACNERATNQEPVTSNQEPVEKQRAARLPADWSPNDQDLEFCRTQRPDLNLAETESRFRDYWIAQPGVKGRKTDWSATWRNWVRNEKLQSKESAPFQAKPILPVEQQVPALACKGSRKPEGMGDLKGLVKRVG